VQIIIAYIALASVAIGAVAAVVFAFKRVGEAMFYPTDKNYRPFLLFFFVFAGCLVIVMLCVTAAITLAGREPGQFGDFFGGVTNPILSFLTIAGLLITIVMQQDATREARDQAARQMFDASFFQMVTLLNSMVNEFEIVDEDHKRVAKGKDCFRDMHIILRNNYGPSMVSGEFEKVGRAYATVYGVFSHILPHYFRVVFNIVKSIDASTLTDDEKKHYVRLLRAQLSNYETGIIFYNSLMEEGRAFKPLIRKYDLMDNFPTKLYLRPDHLKLLGHKPYVTVEY